MKNSYLTEMPKVEAAEPMFFKNGRPAKGPFIARPDAKSGLAVVVIATCGKCAGYGTYSSYNTGTTGGCWTCGGARQMYVSRPVYTAAQVEKKWGICVNAPKVLDREDTAVVEAARPLAATDEFVASVIETIMRNGCATDRQREVLKAAVERAAAKAERAARLAALPKGHIGAEGERLTVEGEVVSTWSQDGVYGTSYSSKIATAAGVVFYRGTRPFNRGSKVRFVATVEKHITAKDGTPLTVVKRPAKIEVTQEYADA